MSEKRLTANDPVSQETLQAFGQLEDAKIRVAMELLTIEQRKIQLLAATKKLDEQHSRLFEAILVERGLPPDTRIDIDVRTGGIKVHNPQNAAPPVADPPVESEATP